MAGSSKSKTKLLYLSRILHERSDDENFLTVEEIITELKKYDIDAERKSIYSDLRLLEEFGIDICRVQGRKYGYFIGNRDFEISELRLMIDAIQSAKFITPQKSKELIKKIEGLTSKNFSKKLETQVFINDRIKYDNEEIYYNVDKIHNAITENKMVSFKYYKYDLNKNREFRNGGMEYLVNPYALTWFDDNYYLVGNYHRYNNISHYRIDRICSVNVLDKPRRSFTELVDYKYYFNTADYSNKIYNMFSGELKIVDIRFENYLIDAVIDRFGVDVTLLKQDEESFIVHTQAVVSDGFISWLLIFGDDAEVIEPKSLRHMIKEKVNKINNLYK